MQESENLVSVLVIASNESLRRKVCDFFRSEPGFIPLKSPNPETGVRIMKTLKPDVVLLACFESEANVEWIDRQIPSLQIRVRRLSDWTPEFGQAIAGRVRNMTFGELAAS